MDSSLFLLAEIPFGIPLGKKIKKDDDLVQPGLVNRVTLRETLSKGISEKIIWNKKFVKYQEFDDHVVAFFEDGTQAQADLLIGCDGANSKVRKQRCPKMETEQINIHSFAAAIKSPKESEIPILSKILRNNMIRVLGPQGHTILIGEVQNSASEKVIFWAMSHPKDGEIPLEESEAQQKKIYEKKSEMFHQELQKMVKMPSEIIMFRELQTVKPLPTNPMKPTSRVTLLGDAAHAMTTHRGLGANTALRDARDLADVIILGKNLSEYEDRMIPRGFSAIKESRRSTDGIHATGIWAKFTWMLFYVIGTVMWLQQKLKFF